MRALVAGGARAPAPTCEEEALLLQQESSLPRGTGQYINMSISASVATIELNDPFFEIDLTNIMFDITFEMFVSLGNISLNLGEILTQLFLSG